MRIATFKSSTPYGDMNALLIETKEGEELYESASEDRFVDIISDYIAEFEENGCLKENALEIFAATNIRISDDTIIAVAIDDIFPPQILDALTNNLVAFALCHPDVWVEYNEPRTAFIDRELEAYELPCLAELYRIPRCSGQVFEKATGGYVLLTDAVLDDWLDKCLEIPRFAGAPVVFDVANLYEDIER